MHFDDSIDEKRDIFHVSPPEFSESEVARFRSITTELTEEFINWLRKENLYSPTRPQSGPREYKPEIIHYTSLDGFVGITHSKSFYATNLFSVNDNTEIVGVFRDIEKFVRGQITSSAPAEKEFFEYLIRRMMIVGRKEPPRSFVVSFTDMPDETLHWQGYGRADGLALHFNRDQMEAEFRHESSFLFRCVYKKDTKSKIIHRMFDQCRHARRKYVSDGMPPRMVYLIEHAIIFAHAQFFAMFKHSQFVHEREWRLVYYNRSDADPDRLRIFKRGDHLNTRYEFVFDREFMHRALTRVTLGPNRHESTHQTRATEFAVAAMLRQFDFDRRQILEMIRYSTSPYRPGY